MGTSVRKMYDAELLQLDTMLARMGHAAGGAIESAMTALRTGDVELARSVIARDSEIDSAEHEIEHRCLTLFLRQQPVAGDLRKVSTALKMVTDIERIADQASDIAEITLHLHPEGARTVGVLDDLYAMGDIALHMVKDAIAAYVQVDLSTAAQVIARDDECDAMFGRISKEIAAYIAAHPDDAETALDLFMIDKYLERLGDHAVNIAEWVEFLKTGVHKPFSIFLYQPKRGLPQSRPRFGVEGAKSRPRGKAPQASQARPTPRKARSLFGGLWPQKPHHKVGRWSNEAMTGGAFARFPVDIQKWEPPTCRAAPCFIYFAPRPAKTTYTVLNKILMSFQSDQLSM